MCLLYRVDTQSAVNNSAVLSYFLTGWFAEIHPNWYFCNVVEPTVSVVFHIVLSNCALDHTGCRDVMRGVWCDEYDMRDVRWLAVCRSRWTVDYSRTLKPRRNLAKRNWSENSVLWRSSCRFVDNGLLLGCLMPMHLMLTGATSHVTRETASHAYRTGSSEEQYSFSVCLQKPAYTFSFLIVLALPACSRLSQKRAI